MGAISISDNELTIIHCTLSLQSVTDRSQEDPHVPGRRSRMLDPLQLYFTTSLSAEVSCHCMVTLIQSIVYKVPARRLREATSQFTAGYAERSYERI